MVVEGGGRNKYNFQLHPEKISSSAGRFAQSGIPFLEQMMMKLTLEPGHDVENGVPSAKTQSCLCVSSQPAGYGGTTERELVTIVILAQMLQENPAIENLARDFLSHTVLIGSLPLSKRRQAAPSPNTIGKSQLKLFISDFSRLASALLSSDTWRRSLEAKSVPCDLSDLIDGRLLEAISIGSTKVTLPPQLVPTFVELSRALCALSSVHLEAPSTPQNNDAPSNGMNDETSDTLSILPFSNPVFDKHLAPVNLKTALPKASNRLSGRIHREVTHWLNAKRRLDPKQTLSSPANEKEKFRALKRNQFFMAEMQAYAASLTNAAGKALEPETVTVSDMKGNKTSAGKEKDKTGAVGQKPQGKASTNRKGAGKKAMLEEIASNKAMKDSESEDKVFAAWRTLRRNLESERHLHAKYDKIKAYLRDLPDSKRKVLESEVQYHLLVILYNIYRGLRKGKESDVGSPTPEELFGVAALLWDTVRRLATVDGLTTPISNGIKQVIKALNMPDPGVPTPTTQRELTCDPQLVLPKGDELFIGLRDQEFQLLHCGPYMDRNLDSAPDPRVPFQPDGWQRKVLDELDGDRSVFVVAPTSAGKTFISFYAMEKVLRANDDSVLGKRFEHILVNNYFH